MGIPSKGGGDGVIVPHWIFFIPYLGLIIHPIKERFGKENNSFSLLQYLDSRVF